MSHQPPSFFARYQLQVGENIGARLQADQAEADLVKGYMEYIVSDEGQQAAAAKLKAMMREAGLPVMLGETHIVPVMVGDPVKAKKISDILLAEYGVYVQPINYPTVPRGTERLRFTPGPAHDETMMRELTDALVEIWGRLELRQAA